jgi:hypothetical protein
MVGRLPRERPRHDGSCCAVWICCAATVSGMDNNETRCDGRTSTFVVDVAADDRRRETLALDAGWCPDVAGEAAAALLLYTNLDADQQATLGVLRVAGVL